MNAPPNVEPCSLQCDKTRQAGLMRLSEPTRAASLFLVYHTARAASGAARLHPHSLFCCHCCQGNRQSTGGSCSLLDVTCKTNQASSYRLTDGTSCRKDQDHSVNAHSTRKYLGDDSMFFTRAATLLGTTRSTPTPAPKLG